MIYYFAVEKNISNTSARGTKYLMKKGVRYPYEQQGKEHGFTDKHKAELELKNAKEFWRTCTHKFPSDIWEHYLEEKEM